MILRLGASQLMASICATWLADFRQHIALVPQDAAIFAVSAMENIRFGRPEASDADVIAAAKAAAAHDFISALPDGYDTMLGNAV